MEPRKQVHLILVIFVFCFWTCNESKVQKPLPKAVKGVLDLRYFGYADTLDQKRNAEPISNSPSGSIAEFSHPIDSWDFSKDGAITIHGEWEFYWGEFISPEKDNVPIKDVGLQPTVQQVPSSPLNYISVPGSWSKFILNEKPVGGEGFATYRLHILMPIKQDIGLTTLPDASINQPLGLKLPDICTAFKLFVNGNLITEVGKIGKSDKEATPAYLPQVVSIPNNTESIEILIQVANFDHAKGGLVEAITIGNLLELQKLRENNLLIDLFLVGALTLMGIYHLGLFTLRRKDKSTLYLGLFCFLMVMRNLYPDEYYWYTLFPNFPWTLGIKLEYLTLIFATPTFLLFLNSIYPKELPKWILIGILTISSILSVAVIVLKDNQFTKILFLIEIIIIIGIIFSVYSMSLAIIRRISGAISFFAGSSLFALIILNDILYNEHIIQTGNYAPFGFLIFIFSQAYFLSMRSSRAFNQVETFTETLENKISEGVKEQQKFSHSLLSLTKSKTIIEQGFESAIKEVTEICAKTLKVERCSIWVFNENQDEIKCIDLFQVKENNHNNGNILKEELFPAYFKFLKGEEGIALSAPDIRIHPATKELIDIYSKQLNIHSLLSAPIRLGGRLLGVICCKQIAVQKDWTHEEENFVSVLTNIIASHFESKERQEAYIELTKTKKEIEDLNQFTNRVNALPNLNDIFIEVSKYAYENYKIIGSWLFLPDAKNEYLYAFKIYSYKRISDENYNYTMSQKVPLKEIEGGMLYLTFKRKKPFYLSKIPKFEFGIDKELVEKLGIKSLLQVPLVRKDECVGVYGFSNLDREMHLSKSEIRKLSNLCSQLAGAIDTNHLLQQVVNTRKEVEALNEISKSVNSSLNLFTIIDFTMSYIRSNFDIEFCATFVIDKKLNKIAVNYLPDHPDLSQEEKNELSATINLPLNEANHVHGYVYQSKQTLYTKELTESVNETEIKMIQSYKLKSYLCIPLLLKKEVIGFLGFANYGRIMDLSEKDISTLEKIAAQVTSALQNANLLLETEKQRQETENLNKLIKSLNEDLDIKIIMKKVHEYIKENYNINYYGLIVVDKDKKSLVTIDTCCPDFSTEEEKEKVNRFSAKLENVLGGHAFTSKTKKAFYVRRISKSTNSLEKLRNLETTKLESQLIIPLILQNEPIGFINLYNMGKLELSKDDITKLSILGEHLAGIIHGSNLLKETENAKTLADIEKENAIVAQKETELAKKETEFLNEFSKLINSSNILEEVFSIAVEELMNRLDADFFLLQLVDEKNNQLVTRCFIGDAIKKGTKKLTEATVPITPESGSIFLTYSRKKTTYLKHSLKIASEDLSDFASFEEEFETIFQLPLLVRESVIGIMHVNKISGLKKLSKDEIRFTEALCEQLAIAVNNSHLYEEAKNERGKSEKLLLNILPGEVAHELKEKGSVDPVYFENVSVMFTDFKGFTQIAEGLSPQELVKELDECFSEFDHIVSRNNLEKLKTIGDAYMCAGGLPKINKSHAIDSCLAALEIQNFMDQMKEKKQILGVPFWELRLGIHSGPLIAGVVGEMKFVYDVWGDTVNTASRMESSGTPGKINISYATYEQVKHVFDCDYRGEVDAKNKGKVKMYYVLRLKKEFSKDESGRVPNENFSEMYRGIGLV